MCTAQISPEAAFSLLWNFQKRDAQTGHLLLCEPAAHTYHSHEPIRHFPNAGSKYEHREMFKQYRDAEMGSKY